MSQTKSAPPNPLTRRAALLGTVAVALGCSKEKKEAGLVCTDTLGMNPADIEMRGALGYTDKTPEVAKLCSNCQQFTTPPADGKCGGCKVLKGPIHPSGYCRSWVLKPT